jgi:hypothetical protein
MAYRGTNTPLYGPKLSSSDAQRQQQMAQMLLKEGIDLSPVKSNWEALARVGTAGIGGYLQNQSAETEKTYQSDRAKTLAQALLAGQDQPAPAAPTLAGGESAATRGMGVAQQGTKGDPNKVAQMLMANPSTADMGAQLALGQMQFNQNRAATKEDRADERQYQTGVRQETRGWQVADLASNQAFQKEMAAINQAFQSGQMNAQQAFAAQQAAEARAFQGAENEKNRAAQTVPAGFRPTEGGAMAPIPGGPADPSYLGQKTEATTGAKMNDEQAKAAGFADRIREALPIIDKFGAAGTDITQKGIAAVPGGNFLLSPEYQQLDQAKRNFVNSVLRRESGAVISDSEFSNADKQYFPQPGDGPEVLAQKKRNREDAITGMTRSAGPAYKPPPAPKDAGGWKIELVK